MSLTGLVKGTGPSGFGWSTTAEQVVDGLDLSDRTILLTGCNSGIGLETMRVLVARGATVLAAARSREKAIAAGEEVGGDTIPVVCDLAEPESIRRCVEDIQEKDHRIDALIANAGIMALPKLETICGVEKQLFVNHVGHFLLITGLLEQLTDDGRVVMVSSGAHKAAPREGIEFDNLSGEKRYGGWRAYGQSKLANLLFARELGRRFEEGDSNRKTNAIHPGPIDTNLTRHMNVLARGAWTVMGPLFLKSIPEGAATQVWAAVHPDTADYNGEYMADCNIAKSSAEGADSELAEKLWQETEKIVESLDATGSSHVAVQGTAKSAS